MSKKDSKSKPASVKERESDPNKEPADAPAAESAKLPPKIDGFILWSVSAPPSVMFFDKKDGQAWLERHMEKSGEQPADVRLVKVSEVDKALDGPERKR